MSRSRPTPYRVPNTPPNPRPRSGVALGIVAAVVALAGVVALALLGGGGGHDAGAGDAGAASVTPWGGPGGPDKAVEWWSPVHGEPLGVAVDGADVAAAALDEVRLLHAASGRTRWKAVVDGVRRYRPAVGGDRVAATSEVELVLLDRADGARIAAVPFAGPGPAAVLAVPGGRSVAVAGSETGAILALDAGTGAVLWSGQYPGQVTVGPRTEAGLVVASWHDRPGATVRAFDALTGELRWQAAAGVMAGAPAVAPGTVLFTDGEGVHAARVRAVDARTGRDRWSTPLAGWFDDELESAVDATTLYVLDGMGAVTALDLATGTVRWHEETGRPLVDGRLALTRDAVVFASYDDELMVLDRATGRLRSAEVQRGVPVDLAAAPGRLVVALRLGAPSRVEARPEP